MRYAVFILALLLSSISCFAQFPAKIDSLQKRLDEYLKADTHKVSLINQLAHSYLRVDPSKSELLSRQSINMAQTISYPMGEAWAWNYQGSAYLAMSNYDSALFCYQKALDIFNEHARHPEPLAKSQYNIGLVYFYQGNTIRALDYLLDAMNLYQKLNLKEDEANAVNAIASVYASQAQYEKALQSYLRVLKIADALNSDYLYNNVYHNLAAVYFDLYESEKQKKPTRLDSALYFNRKSLAVRSKLGNRNGIAASQISLGNIYFSQGKYGLALEAFGAALKIKIELGDKRGQAICYENMAEVNSKLKQYGLAMTMIQNAIKIYTEIESPQDMLSSYRASAGIYQLLGRYKEGFEALERYISLSDSIFTKEKATELAEMEARYELARQMADNRLKDVELQKEKFWQQVYLYGIGVAVLMVLVMIGLLTNAVKNRREALKFNKELQQINLELASREEQVKMQSEILVQANEEISSTNEALMYSQNLLSEINKDFTSSLTYAKTIQAALLPNSEQLAKIFPDSFVFIRPKEQVSGDLFWVFESQDSRLIAAIDCTGHGVPGGFMSIAAVFLLNQICRNLTDLSPHVIIKELHANLRNVLRQDHAIIRDGMEIGLCVWKKQARKLYYAGARSNMIYMTGKQIFEFKGDRFAVGDEQSDGQEFTLHVHEVQSPTMCYLFSDGYRDQFGGDKGRKFMARRFKELLYDIHLLDMHDQQQILERTFLNWVAGKHQQIDDVLVLGFKVG